MEKRDFASLTTQEALRVAIFIEARNARIYKQFAELFGSFDDADSRTIAEVFSEMAEEEGTHGTVLQERYVQRFGDAPCTISAEEVEDLIEVPQVADGNIFAIARAGASVVPAAHGLAIALSAEEGAWRFYRRLAELADDPELAAFYSELARFEAEHVADLRRRMEVARQPASRQPA